MLWVWFGLVNNFMYSIRHDGSAGYKRLTHDQLRSGAVNLCHNMNADFGTDLHLNNNTTTDWSSKLSLHRLMNRDWDSKLSGAGSDCVQGHFKVIAILVYFHNSSS